MPLTSFWLLIFRNPERGEWRTSLHFLFETSPEFKPEEWQNLKIFPIQEGLQIYGGRVEEWRTS
ncbi:MAG TPA: hypothetical protein PLY82_05305 [Methanosarcina thermophila]|uniref:hypothetical protein n=1 Tax=Methanosarcina thermophila TaxID=2210 RepID=UPI00064E77BE|nr:hypothetical protein [Methanosarcina thermophila]HOQ65361.1 hypothetical protein [Methanosarcina thermophila]HPT81978.1 hypothetical protein [Methanosarcina thermophila]